ncbi:MAG: hypothetical protein WBB07_09595 [Mycobacterium sp.]
MPAHLTLWHGFNIPLAISAVVIGSGIALILARHHVHRFLGPPACPCPA